MIRLKRIYDDIGNDDGHRVLVDRLWPRGISKDDAALDEWCRTVTPSDALRKWFHADPEARWAEFRKRYCEELTEATGELDRLAQIAADSGVTLLTAAKNRERNHTIVLKQQIEARSAEC